MIVKFSTRKQCCHMFFQLLSSQCSKSLLSNSWVTFEQTAWTDICVNILLQCDSDLTELLLYSSYLKRQINLSAVFDFLFDVDVRSFNFSDFFPLFVIAFYKHLHLIYVSMLSLWFRFPSSLFHEFCIFHVCNMPREALPVIFAIPGQTQF